MLTKPNFARTSSFQVSGMPQDHHAKKKRRDSLTVHHKEIPSSAGMSKREALWMHRFRELCEYSRIHGNCLVPQKYASNPPLGLWVKKQRAQYKLFLSNNTSSMTPERIDLLEGVGFSWDAVPEDWNARFEELEDYHSRKGDCLVPQQYALNMALGVWVNHQRTQYKLHVAGKPSYLTPERIAKLERLNFEWSAVDAKWMTRFVQLARYVRKHGAGTLPSKRENMGLWQWAKYQKRLYHQIRAGGDPNAATSAGQSLTKRRQELLDLLGFPWEETHKKASGAPISLIALKHEEVSHRYGLNDDDDASNMDSEASS